MRTSESIAKIAPALLKAQSAIPPVPLTAENPYFNSKYADLSAVWGLVKEHLHKNGLMVVQAGEVVEGGVIAISTRLLHESGEWIEGTMVLPLKKADPQAAGSAITYARRYSLSAMLGVVSEKDDDAEAATDRKAQSKPKASDPEADDPLEDL